LLELAVRALIRCLYTFARKVGPALERRFAATSAPLVPLQILEPLRLGLRGIFPILVIILAIDYCAGKQGVLAPDVALVRVL
jgi:hypothetical protein